MGKRTALLFAIVGAVVALTAGVAFAATINATAGIDNLIGTDGDDTIRAMGGNDTASARAGDDLVYGYDGDDVLYGRGGDDTVGGGTGNDALFGGFGADKVSGDTGDDRITVSGDGLRDVVRCGPGDDTVVADRFDTGPSVPKFKSESACEHVVMANPTNPAK